MSTRKVHGKRITSPSDSDTWVDILRIDGLVDIQNAGAQGQTLHLKWEDDGDNNNPARVMEDIPVPALSEDFVIPAVKSLRTTNSAQRATHHFKNQTDNAARSIAVKRVYATNLDVPDGGAVDWDSFPDAYSAATREDENKYLDVGIVTSYGRKQQQGFDFQGSVFHIRNKPLLDVMEDAPGGADVVLDPFQIIVNIYGRNPLPPGLHGLAYTYLTSPFNPDPPIGTIWMSEWFEVTGTDGPDPPGTRIVANTGWYEATTPGDGSTITITNPINNSPNSLGTDAVPRTNYWQAGTYTADQVFDVPEPEAPDFATHIFYVPIPRIGI